VREHAQPEPVDTRTTGSRSYRDACSRRMSREAFEEVYREGRWGSAPGTGRCRVRPRIIESSSRPFFARTESVASSITAAVTGRSASSSIGKGRLTSESTSFRISSSATSGEFGQPGVDFMVTPEKPAEIPDADLLVCKDVLQHLPVADIQRFLLEVVPRYPLALVINDVASNLEGLNSDIPAGHWRPVDIRESPFGARAVVIKTLTVPRVRSRNWKLRGSFNAATKPVMLLQRFDA